MMPFMSESEEVCKPKLNFSISAIVGDEHNDNSDVDEDDNDLNVDTTPPSSPSSSLNSTAPSIPQVLIRHPIPCHPSSQSPSSQTHIASASSSSTPSAMAMAAHYQHLLLSRCQPMNTVNNEMASNMASFSNYSAMYPLLMAQRHRFISPHQRFPGLMGNAMPMEATHPQFFSPHIHPAAIPAFLSPLFRKPKRIRTAFSPNQLLKLEHAFEKNHYVVGAERKDLARTLNLSETQVKVWFQNRRTKHKRQKDENGENEDDIEDEDEEQDNHNNDRNNENIINNSSNGNN